MLRQELRRGYPSWQSVLSNRNFEQVGCRKLDSRLNCYNVTFEVIMKYSDARPTIRSGDLLAFDHGDWDTFTGIKTEVVHMATRSTYSHVGIAWVVGGRVFILEAVKPKLRIFPLSQSGPFYLLPLKAPWRAATEEFALSQVGYPYSEIDAIKAFFSQLPDGTVSECAAYVREVLIRDGINLGLRSTPNAVILQAQQQGASLLYIEP